MQFTNTKESGLEELIVKCLSEQNGYEEGSNDDYNKECAIDETRLFRFLSDTQADEMEKRGALKDDKKKREFLNRLNSELASRGVIDLLRNGINDYPAKFDLFYHTPTEQNEKAVALFKKNIFSVTRQLHYSSGNLALDLCIFINGLPVITIELKNSLTGQRTADAVEQYKNDRVPKETLFSFKRCMVHFAVDDANIKFCTKLSGKDSWFLPFDKGHNDGAGNPPNPNGIKTDYLWKEILTKQKLSNIIENYAQVIETTNSETNKKSYNQVFPRYHQLDVVDKLISDVKENGVGKRYLIQHSAGSGKSNSIAWLALQLVGLQKDGHPMIDSVIVVTNRRILDRQIRDTIKQFAHLDKTVAWAEHSGDLKKAIQNGRRIIITTVEKFTFVSDIGQEHKDRHFAIIIDEAHSGQSGINFDDMNKVVSASISKDSDYEDVINAMAEGRKLVKNASYFAFTATPKNKTDEMFGTPCEEDGKIKHRPFHSYTMKQAIEEGFILDVLKNYTTIKSYYKIIKTIKEDPMFNKNRAVQRLRAFVEGQSYPIETKAAMMIEHFCEEVIDKRKINGNARAMVVTSSIDRCIKYYRAIKRLLEERHSTYEAIVAFSGEYNGMTSSRLNGFKDSEIPKKLKEDPYRILVVADMFQTGFDEPLLHTMYVDKPLHDIDAVQTLSRLNRCCPGKNETFVLDFANDTETIKNAFSKYYRTTILSDETDPNKLYDMISVMEKYQVYSNEDIECVVENFLKEKGRETLDPTLDNCADLYKKLEEEGQIEFKSVAKNFVRTYGFLGAILPYGNVDWEKLSIFLTLLIPKLPSQDVLEEDITPVIDLESYRIEKQQMISIKLEDEDAEVDPDSPKTTPHTVNSNEDFLSNIVSEFNELFGKGLDDADNISENIVKIPDMMLKDQAYQNAIKNSDKENARLESDKALNNVIRLLKEESTELFKQFRDNGPFKTWLLDKMFDFTYNYTKPTT